MVCWSLLHSSIDKAGIKEASAFSYTQSKAMGCGSSSIAKANVFIAPAKVNVQKKTHGKGRSNSVTERRLREEEMRSRRQRLSSMVYNEIERGKRNSIDAQPMQTTGISKVGDFTDERKTSANTTKSQESALSTSVNADHLTRNISIQVTISEYDEVTSSTNISRANCTADSLEICGDTGTNPKDIVHRVGEPEEHSKSQIQNFEETASPSSTHSVKDLPVMQAEVNFKSTHGLYEESDHENTRRHDPELSSAATGSPMTTCDDPRKVSIEHHKNVSATPMTESTFDSPSEVLECEDASSLIHAKSKRSSLSACEEVGITSIDTVHDNQRASRDGLADASKANGSEIKCDKTASPNVIKSVTASLQSLTKVRIESLERLPKELDHDYIRGTEPSTAAYDESVMATTEVSEVLKDGLCNKPDHQNDYMNMPAEPPSDSCSELIQCDDTVFTLSSAEVSFPPKDSHHDNQRASRDGLAEASKAKGSEIKCDKTPSPSLIRSVTASSQSQTKVNGESLENLPIELDHEYIRGTAWSSHTAACKKSAMVSTEISENYRNMSAEPSSVSCPESMQCDGKVSSLSYPKVRCTSKGSLHDNELSDREGLAEPCATTVPDITLCSEALRQSQTPFICARVSDSSKECFQVKPDASIGMEDTPSKSDSIVASSEGNSNGIQPFFAPTCVEASGKLSIHSAEEVDASSMGLPMDESARDFAVTNFEETYRTECDRSADIWAFAIKFVDGIICRALVIASQSDTKTIVAVSSTDSVYGQLSSGSCIRAAHDVASTPEVPVEISTTQISYNTVEYCHQAKLSPEKLNGLEVSEQRLIDKPKESAIPTDAVDALRNSCLSGVIGEPFHFQQGFSKCFSGSFATEMSRPNSCDSVSVQAHELVVNVLANLITQYNEENVEI